MITVKLLGGAKKSFSTDKLEIAIDHITVSSLVEHLQKIIPKNSPQLDIKNILIVINGIDSSSLDGGQTVLKDGDVITIIPVIHGGNFRRMWFDAFGSRIDLIAIKNDLDDPIKFLKILRQAHKDLIIQGVRSPYILNLEHARKIILISLSAKKTGNLLSNKLETDILMRFACTRQIDQAIQKVGIKKHEHFILIAIGKKSSLSNLYSDLKCFFTPIRFPKKNFSFLIKEFKISTRQLRSTISPIPLEEILAEKSAILFR